MDIKQLNYLADYFLMSKKTGIPRDIKIKLDSYIKKNEEVIHSMIFFEYSLIELPEAKAKTILSAVARSRHKLEKKTGMKFDFRVALLDYLLRNISTIKKISNLRIIENRTLNNLNKLIEKDELTGLFNFRFFQSEIIKEFSRSKRYGYGFSLILIDIDDFKVYNDTWGHLEGNKVLKKIGELVSSSIRTSDIACRYGGEEFALILPNTDKKAAYILAEKIRKKIRRLRLKKTVTISGGIAEFPWDTSKTDRTLFEMADKSLYQSKRNGKNQFTIYFQEKRAHQRVEPKEIGLRGVAHATGQNLLVENISASGMKVELDKIVKDFNQNKVKFTLNFIDGESLIVDGRIAYMYTKGKKNRTVGLTFMNFVTEIDEKIKSLNKNNSTKKRKNKAVT